MQEKFVLMDKGSPPHVRVILVNEKTGGRGVGITPACAGNTLNIL